MTQRVPYLNSGTMYVIAILPLALALAFLTLGDERMVIGGMSPPKGYWMMRIAGWVLLPIGLILTGWLFFGYERLTVTEHELVMDSVFGFRWKRRSILLSSIQNPRLLRNVKGNNYWQFFSYRIRTPVADVHIDPEWGRVHERIAAIVAFEANGLPYEIGIDLLDFDADGLLKSIKAAKKSQPTN